jgi:hypothetical protein
VRPIGSAGALALLLLVGGVRADEPSAVPAPRLLGPRSGPEKAKALAANGGTAATEKAVAEGLDWLVRHQEEDGSWDADGFAAHCEKGGPPCDGKGKGQHGEEVPCPFDEAISGLAVLGFLGAGHLPGAEGDPYGAMLERALRRIERTGETWALPIATEALAEVEATERKGRWRESLHANVERLLAARQPDGAWGYVAPMRPGSDVPYTAFVVEALVAARDAGEALPDDLGPRVDQWLSSLEADGGKLAYLADGRKYGYTPTTSNGHAAFAIRELLQAGTGGERHRLHLALVSSQKPVWKISFRTMDVPGRGKVEVQVGSLSMYAWWLGTIGCFQHGGATWSAWFGAAKTALLAHQKTDGCARGSWDPVGTYERQTGGRVFSTALGVLILEEPYRHRRLAGS